MSSEAELHKVRRIAYYAGIKSPDQFTFLSRGATSAAWQVHEGQKTFIIRFIPPNTNRPVTYQSEFTILRLLLERGCQVPQPIMNSAECPDSLGDSAEAWAVTEVIQGTAIKKGKLTPEVAQELGGFLAILHSLPCKGYGRLKETDQGIQGLQKDSVSGACARWCWAGLWPFDESDLSQHAITKLDPDLIDQIHPLKTPILNLLKDDCAVINHSDLHGEHIFTHSQNLTGVIDFGAAFIGVPSWDFAVLGYHHGLDAVQEVREGYDPQIRNQKPTLEQIKLLKLVIGLYKFSKAAANIEKRSKIKRMIESILKSLQL